MEKEYMFDKDSFKNEITNKEEAESSVRYLSQNETKFRRELEQMGHTYEEESALVKGVWMNLLASCKRVGFSDFATKHKMSQYKLK